MGPPKTAQLISRLLSVGMGTGEGMEGSARDRQRAQRQRRFQVGILVTRLSLISWSLPVLESLMRSRGALPEVSFFDGGVAGVEVVVEAVFPGDRASGPELGHFGLTDFGYW